MDAGVEGKVTVVTGASRGIGEAIAAGFLAAGARGVVITSRKHQNIEAAATRLADPDRVVPVVARSDTEEGAAVAIGTALERFGACDVLVNNAGTNPELRTADGCRSGRFETNLGHQPPRPAGVCQGRLGPVDEGPRRRDLQ